jgi:hypothetical protein
MPKAKKRINIELDPNLYDRMEQIALQQGISISDLIRQSVKLTLFTIERGGELDKVLIIL